MVALCQRQRAGEDACAGENLLLADEEFGMGGRLQEEVVRAVVADAQDAVPLGGKGRRQRRRRGPVEVEQRVAPHQRRLARPVGVGIVAAIQPLHRGDIFR
jgi:hypothetical protein